MAESKNFHIYKDNLLYCLSNGSKTVRSKKTAKILIKSAFQFNLPLKLAADTDSDCWKMTLETLDCSKIPPILIYLYFRFRLWYSARCFFGQIFGFGLKWKTYFRSFTAICHHNKCSFLFSNVFPTLISARFCQKKKYHKVIFWYLFKQK